MLALVDVNAPGNMPPGLLLLANAAEQKSNEELMMKIHHIKKYFNATFKYPLNQRDERFVYCAQKFLEIGQINAAFDTIKRIENIAKKEGLVKTLVSSLVSQKECDLALKFAKLLKKGKSQDHRFLQTIINELMNTDKTEEAFQFTKIMMPSEEKNDLLNTISEQFTVSGHGRLASEAEKLKTIVRKKVIQSKPENTSSFSILDYIEDEDINSI
jgi:hypothetical protein